MLKTVKSDLFYFARPTYFAHACNCWGAWGNGIAVEFRNRYPKSYAVYQKFCEDGAKPGNVLITRENIICLFTSVGVSSQKSPPDEIIKYTEIALRKLMDALPPNAKIYSPKFNSGLFAVPWHLTEQTLMEVLKKRPDVDWVICEHDPK